MGRSQFLGVFFSLQGIAKDFSVLSPDLQSVARELSPSHRQSTEHAFYLCSGSSRKDMEDSV